LLRQPPCTAAGAVGVKTFPGAFSALSLPIATSRMALGASSE
jgi:hypothetical protein